MKPLVAPLLVSPLLMPVASFGQAETDRLLARNCASRSCSSKKPDIAGVLFQPTADGERLRVLTV